MGKEIYHWKGAKRHSWFMSSADWMCTKEEGYKNCQQMKWNDTERALFIGNKFIRNFSAKPFFNEQFVSKRNKNIPQKVIF
jgi:hypothetical protein